MLGICTSLNSECKWSGLLRPMPSLWSPVHRTVQSLPPVSGEEVHRTVPVASLDHQAMVEPWREAQHCCSALRVRPDGSRSCSSCTSPGLPWPAQLHAGAARLAGHDRWWRDLGHTPLAAIHTSIVGLFSNAYCWLPTECYCIDLSISCALFHYVLWCGNAAALMLSPCFIAAKELCIICSRPTYNPLEYILHSFIVRTKCAHSSETKEI